MSNASDFIIENGVLKKYVGPGGDVAIPDGVKSINKYAFYEQESLTGVIMPKGVTSIGSNAFEGCSNLKSIVIPEGVTNIGSWAFSWCSSLKSITIPSTVKKLGNFIFAKCGLRYLCAKHLQPTTWWKNQDVMQPALMGFLSHHEEFTDSAIIDDYKKRVFSKKKAILPLIFEDDLISGITFFANAGKITTKTFEEEFLLPAQAANATQCIAFLLDWKEKNTSQNKKTSSLEKGLDESLTAIDVKTLWSFEKTKDGSLCITGYKGEDTSIAIPAYIGKTAVTAIADEAFSINKPRRPKQQREVLKKLQSITIPNTVTSIGNQAFEGCSNLTDILIPDSITSIGQAAFEECKSIVSIAIPDSVASIGERTFFDCKKLKNIVVPDSLANIGDMAFKGCKGLADKAGFVVVQNVVYDYFGKGEDITIPDNVVRIGQRAFAFCEKLTSVNIPDSVTSIDEGAFFNCKSLTSINVPNDLTSIGERAFSDCKELADEKGFVIVQNKLFSYYGPGDHVIIPKGVASIESYTFSSCENLQEITIPESVVAIGNSIFGWRQNPIKIHAPAGSYAEQYAKENNIPFVAE